MHRSRLGASAALLALLASTGCAALIRSAAEELAGDSGLGHDGRPGLDRPLSAFAESGEPERTSSTYQLGPTIDWTRYRFGAPYSLSNALFERERTVGQACRPVLFGKAWNQGLFSVDDSETSLSRPIALVERHELDVIENRVRLGTLLAGDTDALAAHYVASAARLGHQGHTCRGSWFAYVWVWGGETTVVVRR